MSSRPLDILVLADIHFVAAAAQVCPIPSRHSRIGQLLARKALWRMKQLGVTPGLIVLLGDCVDDGDQPDAAADLAALAGELLKTGIPVLAEAGLTRADFPRVLFHCDRKRGDQL